MNDIRIELIFFRVVSQLFRRCIGELPLISWLNAGGIGNQQVALLGSFGLREVFICRKAETLPAIQERCRFRPAEAELNAVLGSGKDAEAV